MRKLDLSAALKSGKGNVRTNNEDAYYFNGRYAELKDMDQEVALFDTCQNGQALFAICDGMGGYENGEVASYTAVSRMGKLQKTLESSDFSTAITQWVEETNQAILKAARDGGCTLALLFFKFEKVYIAHIGDSRIYRYHHGELIRMTKDHSKVQVLLDAGIITEEEAETYPQKHVITRALGMNEDETGKCMPTIQKPVLAEDGDWYIICSDGVTDMLTDNQIESLISQAKTAMNCAELIYRAALQAGGRDNTTVIVTEIKCDDQGLENDAEQKDPFESTWTPEQGKTEPFSIEQLTTIRQSNGQKVTIKTQICSTKSDGLITFE